MSSGQMLEEYHQMAVSFNLVYQRENLKFYRDLVSPQKKNFGQPTLLIQKTQISQGNVGFMFIKIV